MLRQQQQPGIRVFVVWQPMIASDIGAPATSALSRIADPRARQYWDPGHLLARQMAADARAPQPTQECCVRNGILWDLAAVYPRGARWTDRLPAATVFNGPVVDIPDAIASALK